MGGARHTSPTPRPAHHHHHASNTRSAVPPPRRGGRRDYEDLDLDEGGDEEEQKHGNVVPPTETYSRLEREKSPSRKLSPPDKPAPYNKKSGGAMAARHGHGPPLPSRPHVPPPAPKPSDTPTEVPDGLYAAVSKPKKRAAATVHTSRPVPPSSTAAHKPSHSGSNPDLSGIGHEEYGKLDHRVPTSAVPLPQEEYNTLDLVASKVNGTSAVTPPPLSSLGQEEYGKLGHASSTVNKRYSHGHHIAEQYGKLEVTKSSSSNAVNVPHAPHYEMQDDEPLPPPLPSTSSAAAAASIIPPEEAYGRLHQFSTPPHPHPHHSSSSSSSNSSLSGAAGGGGPAATSSRDRSQLPPSSSSSSAAHAMQEEYGRLERPKGKGTTSVPSTPEDEYGHLEARPRTSSFNPYGTLTSQELKAAAAQATSSTTSSSSNVRKHTRSSSSGGGGAQQQNNDSQLMMMGGPPPGYENTEIKQPSLAYRASIVGNQMVGGGKPQAPPRGPNTSPSLQRKSVHGYVNVNEKGQIKPLPPTKPSKSAADSSTHITSSSMTTTTSSHDPTLKSHDMNGVAYPVRRKPTISSSDYEDTETLEFGTKPPILQKQKSTSDAVMPPPAPKRGPSIRYAVSASNVTPPSENSSKPSIAPKPKMKVRPVH